MNNLQQVSASQPQTEQPVFPPVPPSDSTTTTPPPSLNKNGGRRFSKTLEPSKVFVESTDPQIILSHYYHCESNPLLPPNCSESHLLKLIACLWLSVKAPNDAPTLLNYPNDNTNDFNATNPSNGGILVDNCTAATAATNASLEKNHATTANLSAHSHAPNVITNLSQEIQFHVEALGIALAREGLLADDFEGSAEILMHYEIIKQNPYECFEIDFSQTIYQRLLDCIRPLDSHRLLQLLDHNKQAENSISNKDVLLLLGFTGVGKSTTTHFLGGSKLTTREVIGGTSLEPEELGYNPDLDHVKIGSNFVESETRYISAIKINPSLVDGDNPCRSNTDFYICDTPGFLDTRGVEIQIANGQGIIDAVKKARRIWPIILISKAMNGQRWGPFRELLTCITDFIPNAHAQTSAFTYIFTHGWVEADKKSIYEQLAQLQKSLNPQEKSNTAFVALLNDLISAVVPGKMGWNGKALMLNPVACDWKPGDFLDSVIKREAILDCGNNFQYISSDKSINLIETQIQVDKQIIKAASKPESLDFPLINYHLTQMKLLKTKLTELGRNGLAEARQIIQENFESYLNNGRDILLENLLAREIWKDSEDEKATCNICDKFESILLNVDVARSKLQDHLADFDSFPERFSELSKLEDQLRERVLHSLAPSSVADISVFSLKGLDFNLICARFDRVACAVKVFPSWNKIYREGLKELNEKHESSVALFKNEIRSWKLCPAFEILNDIKLSESILRNHLETPSYGSLLDGFKFEVAKRSQQLDNQWGGDSFLPEESLPQLDSIAKQLQDAVTLGTILDSHFPGKDIASLHDALLDKVIRYVNKIVAAINKAVKDGGAALTDVKKRYAQLATIRAFTSLTSFPKISSCIFDKDTEAQKCLGDFILTLARETQENLPLLKELKSNLGTNTQLANCLKNIAAAEWIASYRTAEFQSIEKIRNEIFAVYSGLSYRADSLELNYNSPDALKELAFLRTQLEASRPIVDTMQVNGLDELIAKAKQSLIVKRNGVLEKILCFISAGSRELNPEDQLISPSQVIKIRNYLTACQRNGQIDCDELGVEDNFNMFVNAYLEKLNEQLRSAFNNILTFSSDESKSEMLQAQSYLIYRRLNELKSFQDEGVDERKRFHEWCESFGSGFLAHLMQLSKLLTRSQQSNDIGKIVEVIDVCGNLMIVDAFLPSAPQKYSDIRNNYCNAFSSLGSSIAQDITSAIQQDAFDNAVEMMEKLEQLSDPGALQRLKSGKRELALRLNKIAASLERDALKLRNQFDDNSFLDFEINLGKLKDGFYVSQRYLDEKAIQRFGPAFYINIATILYTIIEESANIAVLLLANNFTLVEANKEKVIVVLSNMKRTQLTHIQVENQIVEINSDRIIRSMDGAIKARMSELETIYKTITIMNYQSYRPDQLYANIGPVLDRLPYPATWLIISMEIQKNIENATEQVKLLTETIRNKRKKLSTIEGIIRLCPQIMQHQLLAILDDSRNELEEAQTQLGIKIEKINRVKSPSEILIAFKEAKEMGYLEGINSLTAIVEGDVMDLAGKISNHLREYKTLNEALPSFEKLYQYKINNASVILNQFDTLYENIAMKLRDAVGCFLTYRPPPSDPSRGKDIPDFSAVLNALRFTVNVQTKDYCSILLEPLLNTIQKTEAEILALTKRLESTFLDSLENRDAPNTIRTFQRTFEFEQDGEQFRVLARNSEMQKIFRIQFALDHLKRAFKLCEDNVNASLIQVMERGANNETRKKHYGIVDREYSFTLLVCEGLSKSIPSITEKVGDAKYLTEKINSKMNEFYNNITAILAEEPMTIEMEDQFNRDYDQLVVMSKTITNSQFRKLLEQLISRIDQNINNQIAFSARALEGFKFPDHVAEADEDEKERDDSLNPICNTLIALQSLGQLHERFEIKVGDIISDYLRRLTAAQLSMISDILNQTSTGFDIVLTHSDRFEACLNELRRKETAGMTFATALEMFKTMNHGYKETERELLFKQCQKYEKVYKELTNPSKLLGFRGGPAQYIADIILPRIHLIKDTISDPSKQVFKRVFWGPITRQAALDLLPLILAVKTLKSPSYSWSPHPVQIISILRLLRADVEPSLLKTFTDKTNFTPLGNHLLQIGTGEGKSVTLAVAAAIFALLGYEVNCACYSKYLSERDEASFRGLFNDLGINKSKIAYGTFHELAESFINMNGDIRERVLQTVKNRSCEASVATFRPRILLVDEVDVFLEPDFYCETYNPVSSLFHNSIKELAQYIWETSKANIHLSFDHVKNSAPYRACLAAFIGWEFLIEREVKQMIHGVRTVRNNNHTKYRFNTVTNSVEYKINDGMSSNFYYGYQTIFIYFKECEERKLNIEIALAKANIHLDCGHYLYGKLCENFHGIYGVTGTLEHLTTKQKNALKKVFNVEFESYIPSAYGSRFGGRFQFSANSPDFTLFVREEAEYNLLLLQEIEKRIEAEGGRRAVITFFEDENLMKLFIGFSERRLTEGKYRIQVMTLTDTSSEKNQKVRGAVVPGTITFVMAEFGRGTDFVCRDNTLDKRGGVHVIQTFFSIEKSEEVQIQGRTARNTNRGSYSMVLLVPSLLKRFPKQLKSVDQVMAYSTAGKPYDELHQVRLQASDEAFDELKVESRDEDRHKESMKLREATTHEIKDYLRTH